LAADKVDKVEGLTFQALLLVALGLSMDAFGASVSRGAALSSVAIGTCFRISAVFGVFAAAAPALGWILGAAFLDTISVFDHWIAFVLLSAVGAKMIRDALRGGDTPPMAVGLRFSVVFVSALATSIDSSVFGITLPAFDIGLSVASSTIGAMTFGAAFIGLRLGRKLGAVAGQRAEIIGGLILIVIAFKILADHML
jgi:manganese efflux pump family protein